MQRGGAAAARVATTQQAFLLASTAAAMAVHQPPGTAHLSSSAHRLALRQVLGALGHHSATPLHHHGIHACPPRAALSGQGSLVSPSFASSKVCSMHAGRPQSPLASSPVVAVRAPARHTLAASLGSSMVLSCSASDRAQGIGMASALPLQQTRGTSSVVDIPVTASNAASSSIASGAGLPSGLGVGAAGLGAAAAISGSASAKRPGSSGPAQGGLLSLVAGAYVLPHPDKVAKGGEDWYFIADNQRAIGIADGVGGWADVGVDAGAYARTLMQHAKAAAEALGAQSDAASGSGAGSSQAARAESGSSSTTSADGAAEASPSSRAGPSRPHISPQTILEQAHGSTHVRGSSTACVLALNGTKLSTCNLGDSGFLVLRGQRHIVYHSPQQQHDFNYPFQLGSSDAQGDPPQAAQRAELDVQPGDVIVVGTDGLWDNCFPEEVVNVVKYCQDSGMPVDRTAHVLAHYARHRACDSKFVSPFAYSAFQAGLAYMGGKLDDITIIIASVHQQQAQQQQQLPALPAAAAAAAPQEAREDAAARRSP